MNCDLGAEPDQCRLISTTFFSPLLSFFFVTSFLKRVSSCHFPMSMFHNVENTFEKWEHNIFFLLYKTLCLCSLLWKPLLWILIFDDFSKTKQISNRHFLPKCCKNKLCLIVLLRNFFFKKNLTKTSFFLFGRIFVFSYFLFSSIQEKHFYEQNTCFIRFIAEYLSLLQKLFRIFKMNLFRYFCDFLDSSFFILFRHFLFLFITFRIHLLFHFLFYFLFVWPFYFLDPLLLGFFWTTISLLNKKTLQFIFFLHACVQLYVLLLIHLFICCLFFSLRFFSFLIHLFPFSLSSMSITSLKDKFMELLQKNLFVYFPFHCALVSYLFLSLHVCLFFSKFLFFRFILMCFWTFFFLSSRSWLFFPLSLPFLCVSFSWRLCLVWSSFFFFFFNFLLIHTLLVHKTPCFLNFSVCTISFFNKKLFFLFVGPWKKRNVPLSFLFLLFFSKKNCKNVICSTSF